MSTCDDPSNFARFASQIRQFRKSDLPPAEFLLQKEGYFEIYYAPLEHVNRTARVVLVGISPGPTQMELAYSCAAELLQQGLSEREIMERTKQKASFGGGMRKRLVRMLDYLDMPKYLGIQGSESLWDTNSFLLHSTSILRFPTFNGRGAFNGSFSAVFSSRLLRRCFEDGFVSELALLPKDTTLFALGETSHNALNWCSREGIIKDDQIMGRLAHPSGSNGSAVAYFVEERSKDDLDLRDPIRRRCETLDAARKEIKANLARKFAE